mgnify:CR=1 FL=1
MIKYLIIVLSILIVCTLVVLLKMKNTDKENSQSTYSHEEASEFEIKADNDLVIDTYDEEIMNIKNCIQKYIDYIDEEDYKAIFNILDSEYKQKSQINIDNVNSKIEKISGKYICKQIKKKELDINCSVFYVYGSLVSDNFRVNNDLNYTVIIDYSNNTFSITNGINNEENSKNIESNEYNEYEFNDYSEEDILREQFYNYKYTILNEAEDAFNMLDEEYRNKRFNNSIAEFNNYINEQKDKMETSSFMEYTEIDDNKYVIEDNYNKQYVFCISDFYNYNVKLDVYTIAEDYFTNKYNALDDSSKAHTNVDVFIKMINSKDYKQAYNKLDESFRNNNFGSVDNFENYIKENFFENNYLEVNEIEQKGEYYVVKTTLMNNISSAADSMEKNFVVKLNEGTDFTISFEI